MSLPQDPVMLLSVVNTLLRDRYEGLDALCGDLEVERAALEHRLGAIGYIYHHHQNQFR